MQISLLHFPDHECDEFVRKMHHAKLDHMPAWSDVIQRTFGHKCFDLVARDDGKIRGVFPLTQVRSRFFGNRMVSQAFSNYGGPLAESREVLDALWKHAVELAMENGCDSIEVRNIDPLPYDLHLNTNKVGMYVPLPSDPDELWRSFTANIRSQVRKAEKFRLVGISGGVELLDDFYRVWTRRMHQLGTPCYPRKFFYNICQTFPGNCRFFVVRLKGLSVGVAFLHCFKDFVQFRWVSTLVEYNHLRPNYLLWWSIMKHYCEEGASYLDFGRSTIGSTQYEHKMHWHPKLFKFHYQYWSRPDHNPLIVTPSNPKYKNRIETWKKLPLWVTRLAGPFISRDLP